MSVKLTIETERYPDTPLTYFPVGEDTFSRMSDVNSVQQPIVKQFNTYWEAGNIEACNILTKNNPDLLNCLFNAEKYNRHNDAIIALERFFLNNVETFMNELARAVVGINDSPTAEQFDIVAYSAKKVQDFFDALLAKIDQLSFATLTVAGWEIEGDHYVQTVQVPGLTSDMKPICVSNLDNGVDLATQKSYNKAFSIITSGTAESGNGSATFRVYKLPKNDITIGLKGV